jgi:hypothetical protein
MSAIKNLTSRPIFVPLNSGTNLRLSPGKTATGVSDHELKGNAKVEKLLGLRAIAVETESEKVSSDKSAGAEAGDARPNARDKTRDKT